ncbi:hypothetical protein CYMTET_16582 [Cymbomonas tetramitiformis]|uniref:JmjC domain-containing protein n=1 Tax=Cymbomonas tetramitiformis TaxID=36881 RepID=A0AAE0GCA2_9CHLO|nr:hypothetical protein CYMTET_16582 [Cymbomonas tetramitiformis]
MVMVSYHEEDVAITSMAATDHHEDDSWVSEFSFRPPPDLKEQPPIPIVCNDMKGMLLPGGRRGEERILYEGNPMRANAFEAAAGKAQSRKWRTSCRLLQEDGTPGETIQQWFKARGAEIGAEAVERPIAIYWPEDEAFYTGKLTAFHEVTGEHEMMYDDGESERIHLTLQTIQWLDECPRPTRRPPQPYDRKRRHSSNEAVEAIERDRSLKKTRQNANGVQAGKHFSEHDDLGELSQPSKECLEHLEQLWQRLYSAMKGDAPAKPATKSPCSAMGGKEAAEQCSLWAAAESAPVELSVDLPGSCMEESEAGKNAAGSHSAATSEDALAKAVAEPSCTTPEHASFVPAAGDDVKHSCARSTAPLLPGPAAGIDNTSPAEDRPPPAVDTSPAEDHPPPAVDTSPAEDRPSTSPEDRSPPAEDHVQRHFDAGGNGDSPSDLAQSEMEALEKEVAVTLRHAEEARQRAEEAKDALEVAMERRRRFELKAVEALQKVPAVWGCRADEHSWWHCSSSDEELPKAATNTAGSTAKKTRHAGQEPGPTRSAHSGGHVREGRTAYVGGATPEEVLQGYPGYEHVLGYLTEQGALKLVIDDPWDHINGCSALLDLRGVVGAKSKVKALRGHFACLKQTVPEKGCMMNVVNDHLVRGDDSFAQLLRVVKDKFVAAASPFRMMDVDAREKFFLTLLRDNVPFEFPYLASVALEAFPPVSAKMSEGASPDPEEPSHPWEPECFVDATQSKLRVILEECEERCAPVQPRQKTASPSPSARLPTPETGAPIRPRLWGAGIVSPWLYFMGMFSTFGCHFEDYAFGSANVILAEPGAQVWAVWYSVPRASLGLLHEFIEGKMGTAYNLKCLEARSLWLDPEEVAAWKSSEGLHIPVYRHVQSPGDYIVTDYGAVHWGINLGVGWKAALNFAFPGWSMAAAEVHETYKKLEKKHGMRRHFRSAPDFDSAKWASSWIYKSIKEQRGRTRR